MKATITSNKQGTIAEQWEDLLELLAQEIYGTSCRKVLKVIEPSGDCPVDAIAAQYKAMLKHARSENVEVIVMQW